MARQISGCSLVFPVDRLVLLLQTLEGCSSVYSIVALLGESQ